MSILFSRSESTALATTLKRRTPPITNSVSVIMIIVAVDKGPFLLKLNHAFLNTRFMLVPNIWLLAKPWRLAVIYDICPFPRLAQPPPSLRKSLFAPNGQQSVCREWRESQSFQAR